MQTILMDKDLGAISIQEGFEKFLRFKKMRNLSSETIKYYEHCYEYFKRYFDVSQPCGIITKDTFYDYVEHLQQTRNANEITINTYLRGIRALFYYFMEEDYVQHFRVNLLKEEQKIKETYSTADLERLLKKPNMKKCNFAEYRSWVMINYLLGTGNRIRTAVNLKIQDLDFENGLKANPNIPPDKASCAPVEAMTSPKL